MTATAAPQPEILAPAGSLETFFAAMEAGADAVYVGLKDFSARAKAKNFSLSELEQMLAYAHGLGRKIYVTLNTLVKEEELPKLAETLSALEAMGIDAVILQDLAVWRLAREHFPGLELHASTQMTVHNAAGVKMLEQMGFSRAVLARELSLEEIADIRRQTTIELEHFIHGALCFSFSGQCYFSSFLGGKSGNRGRCAQPCRRRFRYRQQQGYYFSTNDLSAIDLLPQMLQAGVISLKIEGRMKSAEYVTNVVSAYRKVLDAPDVKRAQAVKEAKQLIKASFGRQPTRGFLPGGVPKDIAVPSVKGATGRFLGEVARVRGGDISFKTRDRLHVGDRLRIQPKSDRAGTAFTIKTLQLGRQKTGKVPAGSFVTVPSTFVGHFSEGDAVFKVSSDKAFTLSDNACRRRLQAVRPQPQPVTLSIEVTQSELTVHGQAGSVEIERCYPIESYAASERALAAETLRGVFEKTAEAPFTLKSLRTGVLPEIVIPPKRLKEIRRAFYEELHRLWEEKGQKNRYAALQRAKESLLPPLGAAPSGSRERTVAVGSVRDAHLLSDPSVDRLVVPLTAANVQGMGGLLRRTGNRPERLVWDLPFILIGPQWQECQKLVHHVVERGFSAFRLNNLGHFHLFEGLEGLHLETGYRLFSLNSQALLGWKSLGVERCELYIEDDRENLGQLLKRSAGVAVSMPVYGPVPLITSRIPIRGVQSKSPVVSDRGEHYRVNQRAGLSILTSETDFSLLGRLEDLAVLGCSRWDVDLSHVGPFSPRGKQVMEAFRHNHSVPETSVFNFDQGME